MHGRGACIAGGVCGRWQAWQGAGVAGEVCGRGGMYDRGVWQEGHV